MKSMKVFLTALFLVFGTIVLMPNISRAEMMKDDKGMMMGDMKENSKAETAIQGYCPVCVIHGMAMKGNDHFVTEYKGKVYKFAGFNEQKAFIENPEEYTKELETKFEQLKK